uniref:Lysosomal acid lipase/cholesteryl ester hydrolase-like n=1 Tax=Pogona vitticeps TaxID=103695 RepID=A0ABM5FVC4_9SAUR
MDKSQIFESQHYHLQDSGTHAIQQKQGCLLQSSCGIGGESANAREMKEDPGGAKKQTPDISYGTTLLFYLFHYRSHIWLVLAAANLIQQAVNSEEFIIRRHLNPQEFMTVNEILHYWGYPSEEYQILTEDGYYLTANRIPYGRNNPVKPGLRPAVLLVPGLVIEGREIIANLPNNSLGFVLADAGYDVWIINNRGTTWSRKHQNLTIDQEEFWDFTFHEMAIYDLPATMNFILQKTHQEGLYIIGHSQGASLGFITFTVMPQLAKKVKLLMCLAPGYTFVGMKGPLSVLLSLPEGLIRLIWGNKEFCPVSNRLKLLNAKLCSYAIIDKLCLHIIFICAGYNEKNLNVSRADVYFGIYPDYSSVKTIIHWGQIAKSKEFKYFDYGSKNEAIYNMSTPPFYRIEDMAVPTAVWSGGKDIIEDKKDIKRLLPRITHLVFYKNIPSWQHLDFIWGLDAPESLYTDMLCLMQKFK